MKEIERPRMLVPPPPVNPDFWRLLDSTVSSGRAVELTSLEEAGFSSVQSLRTSTYGRAKRARLQGHVCKTGAGYAVWFTKPEPRKGRKIAAGRGRA